MNGAWIYIEIARWASSLFLVYIGYIIGRRSQKIQALREYVTATVRHEYPPLIAEIKQNTKLLHNFLEYPDTNFVFTELDTVYNKGLEEFMNEHHEDLYSMIDFYRSSIVPEFHKLKTCYSKLREEIFSNWATHLRTALPKVLSEKSTEIAHDLVKTINPYYVIPYLLMRKYENVKDRIEACITHRTPSVYHKETGRQNITRIPLATIDSGLSQSLVEETKAIVEAFLDRYDKLKSKNDDLMKRKLLPLFQKYLSKPI